MTSISHCFTTLRQQGQCALIPFITAGDPDMETTAAALQALDANGADIIEVGVPYSDPLADGPVIQAAATRALQKGVQFDQVLAVIQSVRAQVKAPIVLFTYYNPILNRGIDAFVNEVTMAGVQGLVVPDLPLEEMDVLMKPATVAGLEVVLLVAPTSSSHRIAAIARQSQGFIYLVSVTGVTGVRSQIQSRVKDLLSEIRHITQKPVGVGFGISDPEQARQVRQWGADAVIVGSALVKRLATGSPSEGLQSTIDLCRQLKQALVN